MNVWASFSKAGGAVYSPSREEFFRTLKVYADVERNRERERTEGRGETTDAVAEQPNKA